MYSRKEPYMARMTKAERAAKANAQNARAVRSAADANAKKTPAQLKKTIMQAARTYRAQIENGATPAQARRAFNSYGLTYDQVRKAKIPSVERMNLTFNNKGSRLVSNADSSEA